MEKGSSSRIPKLTFGFRKSPKNNGTISEGNSPRGGGFGVAQTRAITPTPTGLHSAPGSSNTSPNLSRSKSLRVPRSNLQSLKSRSNSALQEEEPQGGRGDNLKSRSSTSLLERNSIRESSNHTPSRGAAGSVVFRPRSKTIGSAGRRAINRHSRSVSPSKVIGDNETNDVDSIDKDSIEGLPPFRRQAKSFSAKRQPLTNGSSPPSSSSSSPITRANSVRRSKTPTPLTGSVRSRYNQDATNGGRVLVCTGSSGRLNKQSTPDGGGERVILRRSSAQQDSTSGSPRVKRYSTSFTPEDAGIYGSSADGPSTKGLEVGKGGQSNSLAATGASARSHSSAGYNINPRSPSPTATPLSSHSSSQGSAGNTPKTPKPATPLSSHGSSAGNTTPKPAKFLSNNSRSSSIESQSARPSSAAACYRRTSVPKGTGSTPSSGRTTPVSRVFGGKEGTDGGAMSSRTGLPPRTPYRVARTKAVPSSELAGMNELEGSVLLEADDYRRLFNEVKALKTALLRLKREIQDDTGASSPAANGSRVGRSRTSPSAGHVGAIDYSKKLKAAEQEKEAMSDELAKLRKENKVKTSCIEVLNKELAKEKEEHQGVVTELGQVTGQRDRLLDKVERLHADKHTLEARLNTLERASMYEQTWSESWLDELDEGGSSFGESLDTDPSSTAIKGKEKKGTESDVTDSVQSDGGEGESSEPESTAMCSAPII